MRSLLRVGLCVAALAFVLPSSATAYYDDSITWGWTVIDGPPSGLPGDNRYAWKCQTDQNNVYVWPGVSMATALTGVSAKQSGAYRDCTGTVVDHQTSRVHAEVEVFRFGDVCLATVSATNTWTPLYTSITTGAGTNQCYDPGDTVSRHRVAFWKDGFCAAGDNCVWGWELMPSQTHPVP